MVPYYYKKPELVESADMEPGIQRQTIKLYEDFQLHGDLLLLTPHLVQDQGYCKYTTFAKQTSVTFTSCFLNVFKLFT